MKRGWRLAAAGMLLALAGCAATERAATERTAAPVSGEATPGAPPGVAGAAGEKAPSPGGGGTVIAKVGDREITEAMLQERVAVMPSRMRGRFDTPSGKKNLLESMVEMELLYGEAKRQGLDRDPETLARIEESTKKAVSDKLVENFLASVAVTDEEVRKEYEAEASRYTVPKRVKVSQIVFLWDKDAPASKIAAMEKDAAGILERARNGEDFAGLAKNYSLDAESAAKEGDIGYASRRNLSLEAYEAAMALGKAGDTTGLVRGREEIRILRATEVLPESKKPFDEVKETLGASVKNRRQREEWQKYMDELKAKQGVEIHEERLGGTEKKERLKGKPVSPAEETSGGK